MMLPVIRDDMTDVRAVFLECLASFRGLAGEDDVVQAWNEPSVVADYTIGALVGHVLSTSVAVERYLDVPSPLSAATMRVGYYGAMPDPVSHDEVHAGIRERGARLAEQGHDVLMARFDAAIRGLGERLAAEPSDRVVEVMGGATMRLDDYLETRVVELVVHGDDLATTLHLAAKFPASGVALTVEHLVEVARRRHGDLAVMRALARRERDAEQAVRVF